MTKPYYRYWGKAQSDNESGPAYHLLPYHCLDVAAVGHVWWQKSHVIRQHFMGMTDLSESETYAWLMFFIALHDLGKFDVRFQLKAPEVVSHLWPECIDAADSGLSRKYYHGEYSSYWLFQDLDQRFHWAGDFSDDTLRDCWQPWMNAVAGHHGVIPEYLAGDVPRANDQVIAHDKTARLAFIASMETLFLQPAGLSLGHRPPAIEQNFLAGFCSVCDWLGSMQFNGQGIRRFDYVFHEYDQLGDYFDSRLPIAEQVLQDSGMFHLPRSLGGMVALFPDRKPRQVQTLIDDLPVQAGLTIIEAPTGSGKTEAALAYASHLLAQGMAESIIFALPTQATANAMFERLLTVAEKLYPDSSNMLLAHGKACFNEGFINLKDKAAQTSPQHSKKETEASIQCAQWLSQSRKRVFLGQVGVCTIDQVLISALPVKHKFVRSFGLGKSVLIVDEVHAYDTYMYGLLQRVIENQKNMQGSMILLSATLPHQQKKTLASAWEGRLGSQETTAPYPLITHISQDKTNTFVLSDGEQRILQQAGRQVQIEIVEQADMQFDNALLDRVIQAAACGANVVLICNLVADAQITAQRLEARGAADVALFHSRFRFKDRQKKEQAVLANYGPDEGRKQGGILVATQVVEQSLDLDFDWMLTQLCPIDLLFQRLGRLHRHDRARPAGFENPCCIVIVPTNQNYALHKLIYGNQEASNARVLWRTEQLLRQENLLHFPAVYRPMIERVYQEEAWNDEPDNIQKEYEHFLDCEAATRSTAWRLVNENPGFDDSDGNAALLTRDGEMSLNVLPHTGHGKNKILLDGKRITDIDDVQLAETINLNTIPVPASWRGYLPSEEEGIIWLPMIETDKKDVWQHHTGEIRFSYSINNGLERIIE